MKTVGLSFGYHDSSVAIVEDGRVLFSSTEERFTRQKHDSNFPSHALSQGLASTNTRIQDVESFIYHEDPFNKFSRVLASSLSEYPRAYKEFSHSMKAWLGKKMWTLADLESKLQVGSSKIEYLGHHYSHALQAFLGSGFETSAILVVDAVGDWSCSALFTGQWNDGKPEVKALREVAFPHSLGLAYSAVTSYLGFVPNDNEANTMALAAFGQPRFVEDFEKIIRPDGQGFYNLDLDYFNLTRYFSGAVTEKFIQLFGPARSRKKVHLDFHAFLPTGPICSEAQRFADIACSIQRVLENRILDMARALKAQSGEQNLCYAGGVALNCLANQKLLDSKLFDKIHIPPDPGDGGTAIGTALYGSLIHSSERISRQTTIFGPYLGADQGLEQDLDFLQYVDIDLAKPYSIAPLDSLNQWTKVSQKKFMPDKELCEHVSELIYKGKIVGWFQGNAEIGPRALGHRSILMRPDLIEQGRRLSHFIKKRAGFRPYALSMTEVGACQLFGSSEVSNHRQHRWMQFLSPVKDAFVDKVRVGLHTDFSTRPQVCSFEDDPNFHMLIKYFGQQFGVEALLNTSFNPSGYPLLTRPIEAITMLFRTDLDVLVIGNNVILKS